MKTGKVKKLIVMKVGDKWLLPHSRLKVNTSNLPILLMRIPLADRRLMSSKLFLLRIARDAVGRLAANVYASEREKVPGLKNPPSNVGWWRLGRGSQQRYFTRAWYGYELGFTPRQMLECALSKSKFVPGCRFPAPAMAFGPAVLAALINGWTKSESLTPIVKCPESTDIPIPLDRAYHGPDAAHRMPQATRASEVWEPGLLYDKRRGLFVPPDEAGSSAIDVDRDVIAE